MSTNYLTPTGEIDQAKVDAAAAAMRAAGYDNLSAADQEHVRHWGTYDRAAYARASDQECMARKGTPEQCARAFVAGALDGIWPLPEAYITPGGDLPTGSDDRAAFACAEINRQRTDAILATLDRCIALNAARIDIAIHHLEAAE